MILCLLCVMSFEVFELHANAAAIVHIQNVFHRLCQSISIHNHDLALQRAGSSWVLLLRLQ